ncbi:DUF6100 family protein [Caproicibacter sp. BJN0012]|uniref:DUF6100 family protein n=1 Tax=Caproicibacter sp. BJN0012 TaxID=3110227 RepID=UPI002E15A838
MERQIIFKRINGILDDLSRLQSALYAMNMTDIQRYLENYETLAMDAVLRGERITCRLRHLLYATTSIKKAEYMQSAAQIHGTSIEENDGIVEITFPSLMPKRKQWQSSEFLIDPLYFALSDYADRHTPEKFRECVVCFVNIYCKDLPSRRVRDYDNMELKQALDVIATFFMTDDGGRYCDTYNTTGFDETDSTRIFIMEKKRFPEWLLSRQQRAFEISDF